jgi:hypothetical protein
MIDNGLPVGTGVSVGANEAIVEPEAPVSLGCRAEGPLSPAQDHSARSTEDSGPPVGQSAPTIKKGDLGKGLL